MPQAVPPPADAQRILLYGVTGSGKSTAAERVAAATGLPLVRVDDLTWLPGWVGVPEDTQRSTFADIVSGDRWVLDSAYSSWLDLVLARADLVVGLDYPRWLSLQRLLRRTVSRMVSGRPVCNGNRESWRMALGPESIVRWHFRTFAGRREVLRRWAAAPDGPAVLLVRRPAELDRWLTALRPPPGGPRQPGQPGIGAAGS